MRRTLSPDNINANLLKAEYAVRGAIAVRSEQHRAVLSQASGSETDVPSGHSLPFDSVISANIGNPQQLDQKPITFFRQVLSILEYPALLSAEGIFPEDVNERARTLLKEVGSVGAYSQSQGVAAIRKSVAAFIESMTHSIHLIPRPRPRCRPTVGIPADNPHRNLQDEMATLPTSATSSSPAARRAV